MAAYGAPGGGEIRGKQPLVLVLGQVRFSPVRQMADYIPAIQEEFRRHGFPLERAGKIQQLIFGPGGGVPVQVVEQQRWEYRTKDETWSVLVMQDSVVLQTTSYERFEGFAEKLLHAVRTVLAKTEHDQLGVVQRVGLRYVDVVQPRDGEDFRFYLRPGFHGVADEVFKSGTHRLHVESTGKTTVGDVDGIMVVRVVQNDQGFSLPPDLLGAAPKHTPRAKSGELITLVDMDHYIEGTFDPNADWIVARAYEMHEYLVETLHDSFLRQTTLMRTESFRPFSRLGLSARRQQAGEHVGKIGCVRWGSKTRRTTSVENDSHGMRL